MLKPEIEEFAKILVREVRDAAIRNADLCLCPDATHMVAQRWREAGQSGNLETIAKTIISDVVDTTIFYLLHAIDDEALKLLYTASNGKTVDLSNGGFSGLGGWYAGEWRETLSKERAPDNYPGLKQTFSKDDKSSD